MTYFEDSDRETHRAADDVRVMIDTQGWRSLAKWVGDQVEMETDALLRGVCSWDEYQLSVGRLDAFRKVLERPVDLVKASTELVRGDNE